MISQYIDIFINYLALHSDFLLIYFPILVFLTALIESIPGLGTITPGTLFFLFFGFSAYNLNLNLSTMIFAATLGAIAGDVISYMLGKYGSNFLLKHKKILKLSHVEDGRKFFINHGVKSIFIGRFIGPIRSILPLIAGSLSVNFSRFMFYNILSAFLWVFVYIIIGYYFGSYFREIESFVSNTSIILTIIVLGGLGYYYYFQKNKNKKQKNENS
jgi:membrane protein DedA with SNARE-associated domain